MSRRRSEGDEAIDLADRELARLQRRLDLVFLRLLLQRRVRHVSPLLLDMLAGERIGLRPLLFSLRPRSARQRWLQVPDGRTTPQTLWRYALPHPWQPRTYPSQTDLLFRDALSGRGVVVRPPSHARGALGVFVSDDQVEVEFGHREAHGWTHGEDGFLVVHRALPESVGMGIVGRQIADVVDHPAFVGRDYPITECRTPAAADAEDATTTVRFWTGRRPFEMPFRGIASDLARDASARILKRRGELLSAASAEATQASGRNECTAPADRSRTR